MWLRLRVFISLRIDEAYTASHGLDSGLIGWLILNVPVNNFSLMLGWNHRFLGITSTFGELMCLAQGHNTV